MLENGMIVNQDKYDEQCKKPRLVRCAQCSDSFTNEQCIRFGDDIICEFCEREYCFNNADDFIASFILKHEHEFLHDFWFKLLTESEKTELLKKAYASTKAFAQKCGDINEYIGLEKEFCVENIGFSQFLSDELSGGYSELFTKDFTQECTQANTEVD